MSDDEADTIEARIRELAGRVALLEQHARRCNIASSAITNDVREQREMIHVTRLNVSEVLSRLDELILGVADLSKRIGPGAGI